MALISSKDHVTKKKKYVTSSTNSILLKDRH